MSVQINRVNNPVYSSAVVLEAKRTLAKMSPNNQARWLDQLQAENQAKRASRARKALALQAFAILLMLIGAVGGIVITGLLIYQAGKTGTALTELAVSGVLETLLLVCPGLYMCKTAFEQEEKYQAQNITDKETYRAIEKEAAAMRKLGGAELELIQTPAPTAAAQ